MRTLFGFHPHRTPTRSGPVTVQPATEYDLPSIHELLRHSPRAYSGMGGALREAIRDDIVLTARQEDRVAGFAMVHRQGPQNAWICAFGLAADVSSDQVSRALLQGLEQQARQLGITCVGYMDEYDLPWLRRLLQHGGFLRHTQVVSYEAPMSQRPKTRVEHVQVRQARATDLPAVAAVDQAAFGPLWAYQERILQAIFGHTPCFLVSEREGVLLGYVLSTLHQTKRAHVVRLAVHPRWQGRGIGHLLLAEAFELLCSLDVERVSLNTQEENWQSQRLYQRFGFRPTGDAVEVWAKGVGGQG